MKYLKQNFLVIIAILLLVINLYRTADLSSEFYKHMAQVTAEVSRNIQPIHYNIDPIQPIAAKDVMSPSELAKYLNLPMGTIYDMTMEESPIPYTLVNGEYRFSKAAIDKWMESVHKMDAGQ